MAINKEIWLDFINETLSKNNTFLTKAVNDTASVIDNKVVHIANAGSPSEIVTNNTSWPLTISDRTDTDITYNLDRFNTYPKRVDSLEKVELSYDLMASILKNDLTNMQNKAANKILYNWVYGIATGAIVDSTGTGKTIMSTGFGETGNSKKFTLNDINKANALLTSQDVPVEGRVLLVTPSQYSDIQEFIQQPIYAPNFADSAVKGFVGVVGGFEVIVRSKTVAISHTGVTVASPEATGLTSYVAAAVAYHPDFVRVASGSPIVITNEDPAYGGQTIGIGMRLGGRMSREDAKGLVIIRETKI